jgi:solute carrier family 10 (sodium/bile acid cotransporter), member 7
VLEASASEQRIFGIRELGKRKGIGKVLISNWFILGLVISLSTGLIAHDTLTPLAAANWLQSTIVFIVMWMMSVSIPIELIRQSLGRPWPPLLASIMNLGFLPMLAYCLAPLLNLELAGGLIIAACVPSTQASAAVWTRKAGGDDTVAVFVTLITNVACALITPALLVWLIGRSVKIDLWGLASSLFVLVLVPIAIGQTLRLSKQFAVAVNRRKVLLSTLCQVGILSMVMLGAVQMGNRLASTSAAVTSLASILLVVALTLFAHVTTLVLAWYLAEVTGVQRPQRIAVALSGSQKTLMIGLKLAMDCGVSILPMVIYHVGQLIVDAFIADWWKRHPNAAEEHSGQ